jgi:hypothetical protein
VDALAKRWLVLPPAYVVFGLVVGGLSAWAEHGVGMSEGTIMAVAPLTLWIGAIFVSAYLVKGVLVGTVLSMCLALLGLVPMLVGWLHVACGAYHSCL